MLSYYFLTPTEQKVFDIIRTQAKNCDGKFRIPYTDRIKQILQAMKYECPETFSVNWDEYSWITRKIENLIEVTYTPACTGAMYKEVLRKADDIVACITGKTEWSKVKQAHDLIIKMANYDKNYFQKIQRNPNEYNPHRHSIYGLLIDRLTVCEGVSQLMNYILNKLGIFCYVICGKIHNMGELHAWNIVKIENDYYHVDTTFDMGITSDKNYIRYDYFCLDDNTIKKDRDFTNKDAEYISMYRNKT